MRKIVIILLAILLIIGLIFFNKVIEDSNKEDKNEIFALETLIRQYNLNQETLKKYVDGELEIEHVTISLDQFKFSNYMFSALASNSDNTILKRYEESFPSIFNKYWDMAIQDEDTIDLQLLESYTNELEEILIELKENS